MNSDVQLSIQEEIVAAIGDLSQPMTYIEERLGYLHQQAEHAGDQEAMMLVVQTWEHVQIVHQAANTAQELAIAAKEMAETLNEQRNKALAELEAVSEERDDLIGERDSAQEQLDDIKNDLRNPWDAKSHEVSSMVEMIEDSAYEGFYQSIDTTGFEDDAYDRVWQNALDNLTDIGVDSIKADAFVDIILNDYYMSKLTDAQRTELRDFIEQFVILEDKS
jgi:hypothetical protein